MSLAFAPDCKAAPPVAAAYQSTVVPAGKVEVFNTKVPSPHRVLSIAVTPAVEGKALITKVRSANCPHGATPGAVKVCRIVYVPATVLFMLKVALSVPDKVAVEPPGEPVIDQEPAAVAPVFIVLKSTVPPLVQTEEGLDPKAVSGHATAAHE